MGALAADPLYSLVDTALVGNLGTEELGAVAVGTAAFTASFWLFSFLAYGVTPKVARFLARGEEAAAADIGVQAILIALLAGALVMVASLTLAGPVIRLLGGEGDIAAMGATYLRIRVLSAPFVLLALVGHGWLRGAQDTRTPMMVAVAGAAANGVLDYLFIYPFGWGVAGAAWATVVSQAGVAAVFVYLLRKRWPAVRWHVDLTVVRSMLAVGADLVVRTGSLLAALTLATALAARMGSVALGSWQITMQIFLLLSLTMDALAIAAQALVAKHLGSGDGHGARRIARRLMELGVVAGLALGLILYALRSPIASIFTDDPDVLDRAGFLIGLLAISQPVAAAAFMLDGILIGALMTRFLAGAMIISSALFAAVALVSFEQGWGTTGLAISIGLWLAARVVTTGRLYLSARWALTALPPRAGRRAGADVR